MSLESMGVDAQATSPPLVTTGDIAPASTGIAVPPTPGAPADATPQDAHGRAQPESSPPPGAADIAPASNGIEVPLTTVVPAEATPLDARVTAERESTPPPAATDVVPTPTGNAVPPTPGVAANAKSQAARGAADQGTKRNVSSGHDDDKCKCGSGGRNLVVCIDGTSNQFSKTHNTNVVELYSRLLKNDHQLTFYNSGIGTYAQPSWKSLGYYKQVLMNKLDLAFALRFEKIILSAYAWLADHYQKGDRIFLFGFSRGAYQARALSAMIETVGLIHKGNGDQIPFAYELYRSAPDADPEPAPTAPNDARPTGVTGADPVHVPAAPIVAGATSVHSRGLFSRLNIACLRPSGAGQATNGDDNDLHSPAAHAAEAPSGATQFHSFISKLRIARDRLRAIAQTANDNEDSDSDPNDGAPIIDQAGHVDPPVTLHDRFKSAFSREVQVHFVGAWDTVSSVGVARKKTLPRTTDGMQHVCFFRHALALHERRVKFLPEYARGGLGPDELRAAPLPLKVEPGPRPGGAIAVPEEQADAPTVDAESRLEPRTSPHTKEVWFKGWHGDIGGGADNEQLNRFGPALRWMSFEALLAGIELSDAPQEWEPRASKTDSLNLFWRFVDLLPIKRLSYDSPAGTTYRPHFLARRVPHTGQLIHASAGKPRHFRSLPVEEDPYTAASAFKRDLNACVEQSTPLTKKQAHTLHALVSSVPGQRSLLSVKDDHLADELVKMLKIFHKQAETPIAGVLAVNAIQHALFGLECSFSTLQHARLVTEHLELTSVQGAWPYPLPLRGHADLRSVASTADGAYVLSYARGQFVQVWDTTTGECHPLITVGTESNDNDEGAFSSDSRYFAISTVAGTVSMWETTTGTRTLGPLSFPNDSGRAERLYLSPDGSYLAASLQSGSTIVWDTSTHTEGIVLPTGTASSLAVVPASTQFPTSSMFSRTPHVICGSLWESSVRIWSLESCKQVGDALLAPSGIFSVSACSDLRENMRRVLIAAGTVDGQIILWNAESRQLLQTFQSPGHNVIECVAFSPYWRHIVSASWDGTVRLWSIDKGKQLGGSLVHGESAWVRCVAFSPDGTRLVSGDDYGTVRIWDRIPREDIVMPAIS